MRDLTRQELNQLETRLAKLKAAGVIDVVPGTTVRDIEAIFEQDSRAICHRPGPLVGPGSVRRETRVSLNQGRQVDYMLRVAETDIKPGGRCDFCGGWALRRHSAGHARCASHGDMSPKDFLHQFLATLEGQRA